MNYFMSDIHGAAQAYFKMKEKINFKDSDDLYILGNIFDGNENNPEDCLRILDDIIENQNIHLILGNREYAHVMNQILKENGMEDNEWLEYLSSANPSGLPLLEYIENNLSPHERNKYIAFLISCELSEVIQIGQRYFYLVHGSPCVCKKGDTTTWQKDTSFSELSLTHNYSLALKSDPVNDISNEIKLEDIIIIAGNRLTPDVKKEIIPIVNEGEKAQIIFQNKRMFINCGCKGDLLNGDKDNFYFTMEENWTPNLACVGIDAAGFFVEYLI